MPWMGKTEEDWNGLKLGILKTVQSNSFSKFISTVDSFKNNAQGTYLFVSSLWFCSLRKHPFLLALPRWGRFASGEEWGETDVFAGYWFCHLHVISLPTLSFIVSWGQVIGKIKQNELDCRDTTPLIHFKPCNHQIMNSISGFLLWVKCFTGAPNDG